MSYRQFTVEEFVLDKYFRQWVLNPNAESNLFWQLWIQRHPEKRDVLQEARAIILKMPRINYGWNSELEETLWLDIKKNTQGFEPEQTSSQKIAEEGTTAKVIPLNSAAVLGSTRDLPGYSRWNYQTMRRVAAAVLLVLTFGIAGYLGFILPPEKGLQPIAYLTEEATLGTKSRFTLNDGTSVVLNSGSTMIYPEEFSEKERLIEIKGEAFLEVAKDKLRPFRVKTGGVVTEALGTAFNVRYEQGAIEVALVEGKVQVTIANNSTEEDKLILMPGEQASLRNKRLIKDAFNIEKVIAWKDDILFFDGAEEDEFINRLERWYGVTITTSGQSSKAWTFSGKFKGKSLEYVLKSAGYTMNFSFSIERNEVKIIYP